MKLVAVLVLALLSRCHTGLFATNTPAATTTASATAPAASGGDPAGTWVVMPDLYGKQASDVPGILRAAGFGGGAAPEQLPNMECETSDGDDIVGLPGKIQCQEPSAGTRVRSYVLVRYNVYQAPSHPWMIDRVQLRAIIGMTPDEARAYLRKLGWTGKLDVDKPMRVEPGCKVGRICGDLPDSLSIDQSFTVYVTAGVKVAAPPP